MKRRKVLNEKKETMNRMFSERTEKDLEHVSGGGEILKTYNDAYKREDKTDHARLPAWDLIF